jgi:hypothetical protein
VTHLFENAKYNLERGSTHCGKYCCLLTNKILSFLVVFMVKGKIMHTAEMYEKVANIIPAAELQKLSHKQTDTLEELLAELLNVHEGDIEDITHDEIEEAFRKVKKF